MSAVERCSHGVPPDRDCGSCAREVADEFDGVEDDDLDVCHHGVGFDEACEDCDDEAEDDDFELDDVEDEEGPWP